MEYCKKNNICNNINSILYKTGLFVDFAGILGVPVSLGLVLTK